MSKIHLNQSITYLKNQKAFIDYLQTIEDDYENLEEYDEETVNSV